MFHLEELNLAKNQKRQQFVKLWKKLVTDFFVKLSCVKKTKPYHIGLCLRFVFFF